MDIILKQLFNNQWLFHKEPLHTSIDTFFSCTDWQAIDVPHDWQIYNSENLYEEGISCYKKTFFVDSLGEDRLSLLFEGVYMNNSIYLNGKKIFYWPYGYSQFEVDLTDYVVTGENTVYVTNTYECPNSRWYPGSGIYRNVWLIRRPSTHLVTDGIYISAQKRQEDWLLHIDTELFNETDDEKVVTLCHTISTPDGEAYATISEKITFPHGLYVQKSELSCADPLLWHLDTPSLYQVRTEVYVDEVVADYEINRFGFRTISFDAQKGFYLNGKNVKVNGSCEHHTLGALGAAANKEALKRQLAMLKKMGVNAIRSAHNMPCVDLLNLCDEMGLLFYTECFDMWEHKKTEYDYANYFKEWWRADITSWVRQDRNHACVFIWGIGNEIHDVNTPRGLELTCMLRDAVRELDYYHHAVIAMGSNIMNSEGAQNCVKEVDLAGYNYQDYLYDSHHEKYPNWCIYGSETSSTIQSRGIYHFPLSNRLLTYKDGQCSSLGNCTANWGAKDTETVILNHRDREYCFGQFIWSGWDYIGEPTPYFTKSSYFGQIDTAGIPKDTYYHYMAEWTNYKENPMVHLLPYWDFNEGQIIDVRAYTNAPSVELFFNDTSLGRQTIDHEKGMHLAGDWQIPYTKGTLTAIAYDDLGHIIARDTQASFGDAVSLHLEANKECLRADGEDLIFVDITTRDAEGIYVANSRSRARVNVFGAGRLIGLDNGDSTDYEQYKGTCRKLFLGHLVAIIAAKTEAGTVSVEVTSKGLNSATLLIPAVSAPLREGVSSIMENTDTYAERADEIPVRKIELSLQSGGQALTAENPTAIVSATCYPANASYSDIAFEALTLDGVPSNAVKLEVDNHNVTLQAKGDGEFRLCCSCNNGTKFAEVISELEFRITGLGKATKDPYAMVNGIDYDDCTCEAKLSFLGGVYTTASGRTRFLYEDVDFSEYGATDIHIPIFSFQEQFPVEIWLGDSENGGTLLVKDIYQAKSWYNHYQENVYKLPERIKGVQAISIVLEPSMKLSFRGFYCTKLEKAYGKLFATEYNMISGDSFTIGQNAVTDIGNNVTLTYEHMDFGEKETTSITICGHSSIPMNTIHIRFKKEDGTEIRHTVDFLQCDDYETRSFPLHGFTGSGKVNFIFMPGSKFDFRWFQFS